MCRTRKWAEGRSLLRMWKAVSRVGWRDKAEMEAVRVEEVALPGGNNGRGRVRRWL